MKNIKKNKMEHEVEYKVVSFKKFISEVNKTYAEHKKETGRTEAEIAVCLGASNITVRNCLRSEQMVSDKVLTSLLKCIGMDAKIEWHNGNKSYFITN